MELIDTVAIRKWHPINERLTYKSSGRFYHELKKIVCKYQKIEQIYQKWNDVNDFSYNQAMQQIGEVLESTGVKSQQNKCGHWLGVEYDGYADGAPVFTSWQCSQCGAEFQGEDFDFDYCPRCGIKMIQGYEERGTQ